MPAALAWSCERLTPIVSATAFIGGDSGSDIRFFAPDLARASFRISTSMVLRPSRRSRSRTRSSSLRTSEAPTTGSFFPTDMAPPSAIRRRQRNSRFGATPLRLATPETEPPCAKLSSTMRSFSCAGQ